MAGNYSFRDYLQSGSNRNNTTNVNVVGISRDALSGIMDALDEQAHLINSLIRGISDSEAEAARRAREEAADRRRAEEEARNQFKAEQSGEKSSQVRSIANERRQRAANAAVNGKINKSISAIDVLTNTLKNIGKRLIGIVSDMARQSLRSYDENAKNMRKQFITTAQIKESLLKGDKAKEALSKMGIKVNSDETKSIVSELHNAGADTKSLTDKQIAAITMMNKTMGTDVKTALSLVKTSKDPEEIIKMAVQASDKTGRETTAKLMQSVNESWFARYAQQVGGTEKAISEFQKLAKSLDASLGDYGLSADSQKGLIETAVKISSGQIEKVKQDEIANMLAISGDAMKNPEKLVEGIQNMITRTDISKEDKLARLRVLDGVEGINQEFITSLQNAITANSIGEYKQKQIRDSKQNLDAINQAQKGGKLGGLIDSIMTSINTATSGLFDGGIFGSLSAEIDEMFGSNLTMEEIVSGGFKVIISLLTAIVMSDFVKGGFNALTGAISGASGLAGLSAGAGKAGNTAAKAGTVASKTGASALKTGAKAIGAKALKGIPVVGAIVGAGLAVYDVYDAATYKPEDISTDLNTKAAKDEEKKLQKEMKKAKTAGSLLKLDALVAGAAAGAAIGGPVGAIVGGVISAAGGLVVDHFVEASNNLKDTEIKVKSLEDLDNKVKTLDEQIAKTTDEGIKQQLIALRENTAAQREVVRKQLNEKERTHWANMTGGTTDQSVIDSIRQTMIDSGNEYNKLKDTLSKLKTEEERLKGEEARLRAEGKIQEADNINSKLTLIADDIVRKTVQKDEARQNELNARLALEKGIDTNLVEEYGSDSVQDILQLVREDVGNQSWMHTQGDYEKHTLDRLMEQLSEGTNGNELYDHVAKLSNSQKIAFLTERAKSAGIQDQRIIDEFIKKAVEASANDVGDKEMYAKFLKYFEATQRLSEAQLKEQKKANDIAQQPTLNLKMNASGGIYNSFTPAVVGEAGKEAVIPLERPDDMRRVLSDLSNNEKLALLKALLSKRQRITWGLMGNALATVLGIGSNSTSSNQNILDSLPKDGVPGDDQATLNRILGFAGPYAGIVYQRLLHGWKGNVKDGFKQRKKWYDEAIANAANQEGRELIRGTYAERALDYGVSELGKPYILRSLGKIGYVCNELVNACIQASGFNMGKFRVNGVKATFANIQKGKYSGNGYPNFRIRNDLTPQTAIPGMVFFQDSRKNREGGFQPGHIGLVYYGHQKLHASGGSSNYTKEGFLPNWQTPCRGVTVTPFDGSNYVIGEFPGLFEQVSGNSKSNTFSSIPFGPTCTETSGSEIKNYSSSFSSSVNSAVKKAGLLSDDELNELAKEAGLQNASAMTEFIKQAEILLNSNKDRDSIVAILLEIAKYLRGAVTSSKQQMVSVARPAASIYG